MFIKLLHFLFVHCGLRLPNSPAWVQSLENYRNPHLPAWLYPLQWMCFTAIRNTKLCITLPTFIWIVTFIIALPESHPTLKAKAYNTLLLQLIPPFLLTLAHCIQAVLTIFEYYLIALFRYAKRRLCHRWNCCLPKVLNRLFILYKLQLVQRYTFYANRGLTCYICRRSRAHHSGRPMDLQLIVKTNSTKI